MSPKLFIRLQHMAPQFLLTRIMYWCSHCRVKSIKNFLLADLIKRYQVDVSLAASENLDDYATVNEFFTRALKPGVRPIAEGSTAVSPVDGCISQIGYLEQNSLLQAKGSYYSVASLLATETEAEANAYMNGAFATLYLSPKDYHRVHMPLEGKLVKSTYIPGKLFSVNPTAAEGIPGLFTLNERLVCHFETAAGSMVVVLIGAMLVGQMETVWGLVERSKQIVRRTYTGDQAISLAKGAELGRFNMGSSVIILFQENKLKWLPGFKAESLVEMGQAVADLTN